MDLGGDGTVELVLAWWHGSIAPYDVLVLRGFQPHQQLDSMLRPQVLESLDLNADGLLDIWQITDDGDGLLTFLNTRAGRLVPGPLKVALVDPWDLEFVDLDGNRRMDVVMSYDFSYRPGSPNGLLVVFDDGTQVDLLGDPEGERYWDISVADLDRNGRPDIRAEIEYGPALGAVTTFMNRGGRSFVIAPVATDDVVSASRTQPTVIRVRDNDWASRDTRLTIVTPPRYGRLIRTPRYEIVYERVAAHRLPDTFVYRLHQDGRSDTATVTVRMNEPFSTSACAPTDRRVGCGA